jgi:hypothetical protein
LPLWQNRLGASTKASQDALLYQNESAPLRDRQKAISKVTQEIADLDPVSGREFLKAGQRISLLLNARTPIRNVLGNSIKSMVTYAQENTVGDLADRITSRVIGTERTTIAAPIVKGKAYIKGFGKGVKDLKLDTFNDFQNYKNAKGTDKLKALFKDLQESVDTNPSRGAFEIPNKTIFRGNRQINPSDGALSKAYKNTANKADKYVLNPLEKAVGVLVNDRPFYEAAYQMRLAELKKIKGLAKDAKITPDLDDAAKLYALEKVFQNDSVLATKANQLRNSMGVAGDLIMPFVKTPANIANTILDYTPAGLAKIAHQFGTKGRNGFDQKLFVDRVSSVLSGVGMFYLFYSMASNGMLTSGKASKSSKKQEFEESKGWQPYSFRIGDKNYTYDYAAPVGSIAAIAADMYQSGVDKKTLLEQIDAGQEAGINTFFRQSFMRGMLDMLSGYSPAASITGTLLGSTTQVEPTTLKQIARFSDQYERDTKGEGTFETVGNRLKSGLPIARESLNPRLDVFGQKVKTPSNPIDVFLNPSNVKQINTDRVKNELSRLSDKIAAENKATTDNKKLKSETSMLPSNLTYSDESKKISYVDKKNVKRYEELTPKEFNEYKQEYGKQVNSALNSLLDNQYKDTSKKQSKTIKYTSADDENKIKFIEKAMEDAIERAKMETLKRKGISPQLESGITSYKFITEKGYKKPKK